MSNLPNDTCYNIVTQVMVFLIWKLMDAPFASNDIVLAKMTKVYNRIIYKSQTIFVSNISLFFYIT